MLLLHAECSDIQCFVKLCLTLNTVIGLNPCVDNYGCLLWSPVLRLLLLLLLCSKMHEL
jgi:hypothetical protein